MIKLKPCPFCGGKAAMERHIFNGLTDTYGVKCTLCGAQIRQFYDTQDQAAEQWNRRENDNGD